jgi:hypothetical protein
VREAVHLNILEEHERPSEDGQPRGPLLGLRWLATLGIGIAMTRYAYVNATGCKLWDVKKNGLLQHMRVDGSLAELRISMGALKSTNSVSPETKTC